MWYPMLQRITTQLPVILETNVSAVNVELIDWLLRTDLRFPPQEKSWDSRKLRFYIFLKISTQGWKIIIFLKQ
jgi:hypothetical protein